MVLCQGRPRYALRCAALISVWCAGGPESEFQRRIRGEQAVLLDHISKNMNELNLERCRCIPINTPGADWRVLQQIVADDPSRLHYKAHRQHLPPPIPMWPSWSRSL